MRGVDDVDEGLVDGPVQGARGKLAVDAGQPHIEVEIESPGIGLGGYRRCGCGRGAFSPDRRIHGSDGEHREQPSRLNPFRGRVAGSESNSGMWKHVDFLPSV
jgi:hypothetical protein